MAGRGMSWISRWRPYLVAVIATAVIVALPGTDRGAKRTSGVEQTSQPRPLGDDTHAATATSTPSSASPEVVSPEGNGVPIATTAPGGPVTKTAPRTGAANATAAANAQAVEQKGTYPGTGSAAALANPRCDSKTGRIRVPLRYAPPCVVPWPKGADNGGATAQGVTTDTIKVVLYLANGNNTDQQNQDAFRDWKDYFNIFNKQYELWGRQVQLSLIVGSGSDEVSQRADAIRVANMKPFLVTTGSAIVPTFSAELAARKIVMFDYSAPWKETQAQAPFRWAATPDERMLAVQFSEYVGKRLAGRPAKWAGDTTMQVKQRVFGLIQPEEWDKGFIDQELSKYSTSLTTAMTYKAGDLAGLQERSRTMISKFKADGVTTLIDGGDWTFNIVVTKEATSQLYQPEWVLTGWNLQDVVLFARLNDQQQWSHAFGPSPVMLLTRPDNYETSGQGPGSLWYWQYGTSKKGSAANVGAASTVAVPLFPCLQLAGPNLTPQTFRDGCFAYPPTGGVHCSCVMTTGFSFGKRPGVPWLSYTVWDDMSEKWWDPAATGPDEANLTPTGGYYRRVDGGKRYTIGEWPATEPRVFDPQGTSTFVEEYPPAEKPPQYDNPNPN